VASETCYKVELSILGPGAVNVGKDGSMRLKLALVCAALGTVAALVGGSPWW
jgi:hypothetical protein